jgi:hypothetical protein
MYPTAECNLEKIINFPIMCLSGLLLAYIVFYREKKYPAMYYRSVWQSFFLVTSQITYLIQGMEL